MPLKKIRKSFTVQPILTLKGKRSTPFEIDPFDAPFLLSERRVMKSLRTTGRRSDQCNLCTPRLPTGRADSIARYNRVGKRPPSSGNRVIHSLNAGQITLDRSPVSKPNLFRTRRRHGLPIQSPIHHLPHSLKPPLGSANSFLAMAHGATLSCVAES